MKKNKLFYFLWASFGGLLAYWAVRLWGHFPAFMDTLEYVFPEKWFNVESFRQGRIPLWNPYIACGTPHVANLQSAAFYPVFWIWNLTGLTNWFFIVALFHEALAAAGFYLWLKSQKVSPIPATFCALSFAGSALAAFYWGFPTHLAALAWIPWIFWASHRLTEKPGWVRWGCFTLFWAFEILAGYPFFTFYAALFLGIWMWAKSSQSLKMHLLHGGAFLAALGLTVCQWLPFVDFLGYLHREGWGDNLYSLRWTNFLTLFQPQILGTPGTEGYRGDYPSYIFNNFYLGIVPLGLFLWSFFSPRARNALWKRSAVVWILWTAGVHFLPWRVLPAFLLDKLEPAKACFLFLFCALTAIGLFLQEMITFTSHKNVLWKYVWVLGGIWVLDIVLIPCRVIQTVPNPYLNQEVQQVASAARQGTGEGRLVSLKEEGKDSQTPTGGAGESFQQAAEQLRPNTNVIWDLKSARGYLTIFTDGFENFNLYLQKGYPYEGRILDAAGVNLILFSRNFPAFKYHLFETRNGSVWTRNAGAMPNAWEVERIHEFPDRPSVFTALLDPKAFLENEVFTEKAPNGKSVCLEPSPRILASYEPGLENRLEAFIAHLLEKPIDIQVGRLSPCEERFEIKNARQGFLVFDESYSPGWHAWVDGEPKTIFRAYGLWMTVPLGEGEHQVLFRYEPGSFRLGLFITLLFLMGGGVVFGCRYRFSGAQR